MPQDKKSTSSRKTTKKGNSGKLDTSVRSETKKQRATKDTPEEMSDAPSGEVDIEGPGAKTTDQQQQVEQSAGMDLDRPEPQSPSQIHIEKAISDLSALELDEFDWAEDTQDWVDRRGRKIDAKAMKKRRRALKIQTRASVAEEARLRGEKPAQPCRFCNGTHWSQDCPVPEASKPLKKGKRERADTNVTQGSMGPPPSKNQRKRGAPTTLPFRPSATPESGSSSATGSRRTSTGPGAATSAPEAQQKSKLSLSRRAEKANKGVDESTNHFADGTYVYMKLPEKLRTPGLITTPKLADALKVATVTDFTAAEQHDAKGWVIRFKDSATANNAVGAELTLESTKITLQPYFTTGAQVFVADHTGGFSDDDIVAALLQTFSRSKLSCLHENFAGLQGGKVLVGFAEPPGIHRAEVAIYHKNQGPGKGKPFLFKLRTVSSVDPCPICKAKHPLGNCPATARFVLQGTYDRYLQSLS